MRTKNHSYTHIVSGLMICSTLLGTLVPTAGTFASSIKSSQKPDKVVQSSGAYKAGLNNKVGFSTTSGSASSSQLRNADNMRSLEAQHNTGSLMASASSANNSSATNSSVANHHSVAGSADSLQAKNQSNQASNASASVSSKNSSKSSAVGQVTVNYMYDGKQVGEQTYNVHVGENLDTARMPKALRRAYQVQSNGRAIHVMTPSQIATTVNLQSTKQTKASNADKKAQPAVNFEPKKDITPLPSKQYTLQRKHVVNPMFEPNYAPRIHSASQYKNTVKMTSKLTPRDLKSIRPFGSFSASVLRYKPYMDKVCAHYHMTHYEVLMLAIMQCETGGHGSDVMQSSESVGLSAGSLSPQQSIEQGVKYMSQIVNKAHQLDNAEKRDKKLPKQNYHYYANDNRLLAQTYNYGGNFMDYVAHQKSGYNLAVSEKYSKDVVAPRLGNTTGDTYTYDNAISHMYHKTYLYTNGGNYFYGDMVEQYAVGGFMHPMLRNLIKYSGQKNVFGGNNPKQGFDDAGLVSYGLHSMHVDMPADLSTQWKQTKVIKGGLNNAQPGDLVFFNTGRGKRKPLSHVGFVVDRHTMFSADSGSVGFHSLDTHYWHTHFAGVRRLPQAKALNDKADHMLDAEVKQAIKGDLSDTSVAKLGSAFGFTNDNSNTTTTNESDSSDSAGYHYVPGHETKTLRHFVHNPSQIGLKYASDDGWSDPGDQCVNFANSYFKAIWHQKQNFVFGNGIDMANAWSNVMDGKISHTPHAGAIASTSDVSLTGGDSAGHTFVVQHVFKNGKILVAEENWPGESGSDNGMVDTWDYALLPASVYQNGSTQFFMPNTHKYQLHWRR